MEGKVLEKHRIQTRYAIDLFTNKCFKEAMREFIKLETDPCKRIFFCDNSELVFDSEFSFEFQAM